MMKRRIGWCGVLLLALTGTAYGAVPRVADFGAKADGVTDDTDAFVKFFEAARARKCRKVTIDPGVYLLAGEKSVPVYSDCLVVAEGAEFRFPERLGDNHRRVMFYGEDVCNFRWRGGFFRGSLIFLAALAVALLCHCDKVLLGRAVVHCGLELIAVHYLVLHEVFCNEVQFINVLTENFLCGCVALINDPTDLRIDLCRSFLGIITGRAEIASKEDLFPVLTRQAYGTKLFTHTVYGDNRTAIEVACLISWEAPPV